MICNKKGNRPEMAGKEMFRWPHYIVRASSSTRSGGSSGGLEEGTNGCFSAIRNGAKHTPKRSPTAPTAGCNLSAGTSTWLRARDNWFPRRPLLGYSVNRGNEERSSWGLTASVDAYSYSCW